MASSTCVSVLAVGDRFGVRDQRRVLVRRQGRESDLLAATAGVALLIAGTAHVDPVSGDHGDGRAEGVRREVAGGLCTEPSGGQAAQDRLGQSEAGGVLEEPVGHQRDQLWVWAHRCDHGQFADDTSTAAIPMLQRGR